MKKLYYLCGLLLFAALCCPAQITAQEQRTAFGEASYNPFDYYGEFKETAEEDHGLVFGMNASIMAQRMSPSGKQTAWQTLLFPYAQWTIFKDTEYGSGKIDFSDMYSHYWGTDGAVLTDRAGLANPLNNYTENANYFFQLSYTHTFPGQWEWLSLTAGQYSMFMHDGSGFHSDQQMYLMNFAMSQNATASYPMAGLGAFAEINVADSLSVSAGYQDANNINGKQIDIDTAFAGEYLGFASVSYMPEIESFGPGRYSFLYYYQPAVKDQEQYSWGWSISMEQTLADGWMLFGRANGSENNLLNIKQSVMMGIALLDPLKRNPNDAIVVGAVYNRLNKKNLTADYDSVRAGESAFEAQWIWGISKWLTVTPDLQIYPRAGLNSDKEWVTVAALRATLMI